MAQTQRHKKIQFWDDERKYGNSLIVTLHYGWAFGDNENPNGGEHVRGFDTVKEAMAEVRAAEPCHCRTCRERAATAA